MPARPWTLIALLLVVLVAGPTGPAVVAADKAFEDALFDLQLIPLEGVPAPFSLERLADGKKVSLAEHKGRPLMLYFWATW
jgi:cytochrome oxidase Cu insertion factor (SCO1/SenC/PrrC family)